MPCMSEFHKLKARESIVLTRNMSVVYTQKVMQLCSGLKTFHKVNLHILINIMSFPLIITSYLCCISYFLFELVFSCSVQLLASTVHS